MTSMDYILTEVNPGKLLQQDFLHARCP